MNDLLQNEDLRTPCLVIDTTVLRRNLTRMADYAAQHKLRLRPHTKTHKSLALARMQLELGAIGLTVAKVGEAQVMSVASPNILLAYPAVDKERCIELAKLAQRITLRVALDSAAAAHALSAAANAAGSNIGILIDLDVGLHRTGVQSPQAALELAQAAAKLPGLSVDGIFFYPGHIGSKPAEQTAALQAVDALLQQTIDLFNQSGLSTAIISGGSTPTLFQTHAMKNVTEVRPGTYVFNDMNTVAGGFVSLDDCAARIVCTVVSDAVPGQVVIDGGSKTLTSDRCGPAPDSGHGYVVELPQARIVKLNEEHGQVDIRGCNRKPKVGERLSIIPNHICPCVNLQESIWLREGERMSPLNVDARGKLF